MWKTFGRPRCLQGLAPWGSWPALAWITSMTIVMIIINDDHHHHVDDHDEDDGHLPCSLTSDAMAAGWIGCWLPFTDKRWKGFKTSFVFVDLPFWPQTICKDNLCNWETCSIDPSSLWPSWHCARTIVDQNWSQCKSMIVIEIMMMMILVITLAMVMITLKEKMPIRRRRTWMKRM